MQRRSHTSDAQWLPAGFTVREFGAKSHASIERRTAPQLDHEDSHEPGPGVVHVLNGKALTDKGRMLLAQANG